MVKFQLLIAILFFSSHFSNGQVRYAVHFINFKDEVNSKFYSSSVDGLCPILVDGYLNNKLKAYKFPHLKHQVRQAESQTENFPKRWNRKLPAGIVLTEPFDIMKAEGLGTEATQSIAQDDISQQPVYFLPPTESDTLSKKEFLDQLIIEGFELDSSSLWDKRKRYKAGESVRYGTNTYLALLDSIGVAPTDKQCWELWSRGSFPLYSRLDGLNGISIIGYCKKENKDSTWHPQLLRLRMGGEWKGILQDVDVTFLFSDVMQYLMSIPQPVLDDNPLGYIGNGHFVFGSFLGSEEEANFGKWLRRRLSTKSSLQKKVIVKNDILYKNFMDEDFPDGAYVHLWSLFQPLNNKDIRVYQSDTLMAIIPISSIQQLIEREPKSQRLTYSQALSNNVFFGCIGDFPAILQQKSNTSKKIEVDNVRPVNEYVYLQRYSLETQKFQSDTILIFLRPVWELITKKFKSKNISLAEPKNSMFPGKHDWSKIETVRAMAVDIKREYWVNLLHDDLSYSDYPYRGSSSTYLHDTLQPINPDTMQLAVTYKIHFTPTLATSKFEVLQVSFKDKGRYDGLEYTFDWQEVKRILLDENTAELKYFIERIEKGEVEFLRSENVYGLCESPK